MTSPRKPNVSACARSLSAPPVVRRWPKFATIPAPCSDGQSDCWTSCVVEVVAVGAAVVAGRVAVVGAVVADFAVVVVVVAAVVVGFGFADVVVPAAVVDGGAWVDFEEDPQPAASRAIRPRSAVTTGRCTAAQGTRVGTDGRLESRQVPTLRYVVAAVFTDRPPAANH